ncbi:GLPGLI family protein [Chryseobacterium salipaludis]|uniref:GLPGLI family protein n=1 Tax=Chryseobacterium TaxID=59732 RepID=UPI001FF19B68|nr:MULTISPECIES: GLPGLI family protein [Chryseobacterium]MCJ8498521.1 GLPGLI family protein [Chryseobacterium salipaludis]MCX3297154.1 GLPGLI family protein [Planobacterium sp. JC490]
MKNILFILVFSVSHLTGQIKFKSDFTIPHEPLKVEELGSSTHNFFYKVTFSANRDSSQKRETVCVLQVGENISKFSDLNQLKQDSALRRYDHKDFLNAAEVSELLKYRPLWTNIVVKENNKLTIQDQFRNLYQYDETKPDFKWKLEEGSKKILSFNCNKATAEYSGRTYTAWYTREIPINNGPFKFEGLPGLILEMHDSKNDFSFEMVGIDTTPQSIYLRRDKGIFLVSKEKFRTIQLSYYENPGFFHGTAYSADGKELDKSSNKLPYNLIELD